MKRTMASQRFLPRYRLRRQADFERVYQRRCSASDDVLLVFADQNEFEHPRLGLSVSRKVGPAVVRNRWKRLLRESFRLEREEMPPIDLVIIPRLTDRPTLKNVRMSLVRLARRCASKLAKSRS